MLKFLRAICCAVLVLLFVPSALAQLSTATMYGTVTDPTGAAVPNATVTITQTDTNTARALTTKGDGSYSAEFLPVGPYKVVVVMQGFKTLKPYLRTVEQPK